MSGHVVGATQELLVTAANLQDSIALGGYGTAEETIRWRRRIELRQGRRYPRFGGLVDGTLYLTDGGTDVVAVEVADGAVRWRRNLYELVAETVPERFLTEAGRSPESFAPLALATPETVYVQTSYGLHGLAPKDGREQWRIYLGDQHEDARSLADPGGLAVTKDEVCASYGGPVPSVYAVELFDGKPMIDQARAPVELPGYPVVTDSGAVSLTTRVVWSTDARRTLVFGVAGGSGVTWQLSGLASTGAAAFSSLATDGERVFVCEGHEEAERFVVFALRAATGGIDWIHRGSLEGWNLSTASPAEFRLSQTAVADDTLLTGYGVAPEGEPGRGTLIAISTDSGRVRWRIDLPLAPRDVAIAGKSVYVGGQRTGIVALAATETST